VNFAEGFGWSLFGILMDLLTLYTWVIIIRALISWVSPDPGNPLVRMLVVITEPVLRPIRALVPPRKLGGLDLSPMIAILLLVFLKNGIHYSLGLGARSIF